MSKHPRSKGGRLSAGLKLIGPLCISVGLLVGLRLLGPQYLDQQTLSGWLRPLGALAPLAFILLLAVRPVTLLPGQLFTAVGGILFGMAAGTAYALVGTLLASGLIHLLARRLGRKPMRRLAGDKHPVFERAAREHGFQLGFLACINSVIPADVMLATASASGARYAPLALGAVVGTLPGTLLTTLFGSSLGQGKTWMTAVSATGMVVSLLLGLVLGRKLMRELLAKEAAVASGGPGRVRPGPRDVRPMGSRRPGAAPCLPAAPVRR
ncbi:VTT domain-containing protein [Myxococcus sp. MxC21-1]|uniref:TVP38/TMEM64 family protein n=1 Tax=Myxococcus sp. MxC21-1 TaxID=3041439 RepID=UPI00292CA6C7|nr:VTT domain-containing protein [Myxococcus sp. MxC21-1]WNZ59803.1 VTT domain-containing protein [Myxococcus sp. MxC21-1]